MSNEPSADAERTGSSAGPRTDTDKADRVRSIDRARLLLESLSDHAIYLLDPEGHVIDWPESARRVKGYTSDEVIGRHFSLFYRSSSIDSGAPKRALETAAAEGRWEGEGWRVRKGGEEFWANAVITPLLDEGELIGFGKVTRDLTERRKVLDALARRERQAEEDARRLIHEQAARAAAEAAEQRSRFVSEVSRVLTASLDHKATLQQVADLSVPGFADWCVIDLVAPDGGLERVATARVDTGPAAATDPSDRVLDPLRAVGVLHEGEPGEALLVEELTEPFLSAIVQDETKLEVLRSFGARSCIVAPIEARGHRRGAVIFVTARSEDQYDESDRLVATDVAHRMAMAVENARLFAQVEAARARFEDQAIELEEQADELRSQAVALEETQVELELANEELHRINAHLRETMEEVEAAREEAERANEAKSQFLATMSHELRTPLNAIAGYTELLELGIRGPVTDEQLRDLARIRRNQVHLLGLINDVLNFTRIEAGQVHYRIRPVMVDRTLAEVEPLVNPLVKAKRLVYERAPGDDGIRVMADPERFQQILLNLLANAVKFTQPGGGIELDWEASDAAVRIHVRDTGAGISADRLETIFEPFVQVNRDRISDTEGVGLGLAISRDLARAMDGELVAQSEPGVGSTFTLTLRRAPDVGHN